MAGLLTPQRQTAGNGLLDQPRRVDDRVAGLLGLDPSIQRGAILPFGRDASGEMVMAWPEMAIDTLKSLMLPGHVVQGGEFTPRDVTEMALDVGMLSSVAPAPAGAKRMFGGISAKNAPLDDLAKAEAMEKAGEAADDIWRATGWGRGADQKWRFEIDDSGATGHEYQLSPQQAFSRATADALFSGDSAASARLEQMKPYASKSTADLLDEYRRTGGEIVAAAERGDIERALSLGESRSGLDAILDNMRSDYGPVSSYLKHDDLNAAYPDVSGMHARVASDDLGGARGQYFQDSPVRREQIVMNEAPTWSGPRSTALHELQHAVQQREGFARGGSPDRLGSLGAQRTVRAVDEALSIQPYIKHFGDVQRGVEEYKKAHGVKFVADDAVELAQLPDADLEKVLLRAEIESDPYKAYQALAGEVEARNVQSRMDMDAATRRATPPWATEDVPRDQQIVRGLLGDSGPQMSVADAENVANSYRVGYNPKPLNQSSFDVDYPRGARSDDTGRLVESQEGVKLDAPFVAGRRVLGGDDEGLQGEAVFEAATRLVDEIAPAGRSSLRGRVGSYREVVDDAGNKRRLIDYERDLTDDQVPRVVAHEVGHAIDSLSGKIDTKGLSTELKQVYHDLATGRQGETKKQTLPQHLGYPAKEVRDEMVAEAVRAYIVDPNYLKSVAPETAKRIREAVNTDPRIAKVIQFNQGGAPNVGLLQDERGGEPTKEPVGLLNY
jgi:hypothetical protein